MKIQIRRIAKRETYTIGKLYIDGKYFCDTLEDKDRGLTQSMPLDEIKKIKASKETAIPAGTYELTMDVVSPKYSTYKSYEFCNGKLPRLQNVPGYDGILIHIGNYPKDTEGCILVGENKQVGAVLNSTATFKKLHDILLTDKNNITIEIL